VSAAAKLRLAPVECKDAWYVCWQGDSSDWIARFEKNPGFDAKGWARDLAAAYNAGGRGRSGRAT
jgi:hypothetical protein